MFAPIDNSPAANRRAARPRRTIAVNRYSVDEAYEARLLAEVSRWDDQAAFEEIYTRHYPAVVAAAMRICDDFGVAEDIAQQTFTALWIRAERLAAKSLRLRAWLCTVARNAAIDHVRATNAPTVSCDDVADHGSSKPGPEESAIFAESAARLVCAMAALSRDQYEAVKLVYFSGLTYHAAATATGKSVGTMKTRVRLAVAHMGSFFAR